MSSSIPFSDSYALSYDTLSLISFATTTTTIDHFSIISELNKEFPAN